MPIGTQGIVALIGDDVEKLERIGFGLLKTGCRIKTIDTKLEGLLKWNNCVEPQEISLDEAKELYSVGRIKAFFCDAENYYEQEKIKDKLGTKPFAPLFCIVQKTPLD